MVARSIARSNIAELSRVAAAATEMNHSELIIAGLLGHKVKGVTARYATAPDTALLSAADAISLQISQALDGVKSAKIIQFEASRAIAH